MSGAVTQIQNKGGEKKIIPISPWNTDRTNSFARKLLDVSVIQSHSQTNQIPIVKQEEKTPGGKQQEKFIHPSSEQEEIIKEWNAHIKLLNKAYKERLFELGGAWDSDTKKFYYESDPIAKEIATQISVANSSLWFIETKADLFAKVKDIIETRIENNKKHFTRLLNIVGLFDRLKEEKDWLKPASGTKIGATGGASFAIFDYLAGWSEGLIKPLQNFVKLFPKTPEGKDLASVLVEGAVRGSTIALPALIGYLNDIFGKKLANKLTDMWQSADEKAIQLGVKVSAILHMRIMLQVVDIKLGKKQFADVASYNKEYSDMYQNIGKYKQDKYAWENFYRSEAGRLSSELQSALNRVENGVIKRAFKFTVTMAKDTVEWSLLCAAYASSIAGDFVKSFHAPKQKQVKIQA